MLSQRQKEDLNKAIADYLCVNNYKDTLEQFMKETQLPSDCLNDKKNTGVLEKKWTTVVRLQKKIVELESQLDKKEQELAQMSVGGVGLTRVTALGEKRSPLEWIPRPPEKFCLTGLIQITRHQK